MCGPRRAKLLLPPTPRRRCGPIALRRSAAVPVRAQRCAAAPRRRCGPIALR
jgi:hypothetical protein